MYSIFSEQPRDLVYPVMHNGHHRQHQRPGLYFKICHAACWRPPSLLLLCHGEEVCGTVYREPGRSREFPDSGVSCGDLKYGLLLVGRFAGNLRRSSWEILEDHLLGILKLPLFWATRRNRPAKQNFLRIRSAGVAPQQPPSCREVQNAEAALRACPTPRLMIEILHDLTCPTPRNYGSIVYMGSCRMYIIKETTLRDSRSLPHCLNEDFN